MKNKIIRNQAFESNSSSTHSLSISSASGVYDSWTPDEEGKIYLTGGEFGWGYETYSDPQTKASYCAVDNWNNDERMDMLIRVLKEHTGAREVVLDFQCDSWDGEKNYSYIDHQSVGTSGNAFDSEQTLKDFIFNRSSRLIIDNDNH